MLGQVVVLNNCRHCFCKIKVRSLAVTRRFRAMCWAVGVGVEWRGGGTRYILRTEKQARDNLECNQPTNQTTKELTESGNFPRSVLAIPALTVSFGSVTDT